MKSRRCRCKAALGRLLAVRSFVKSQFELCEFLILIKFLNCSFKKKHNVNRLFNSPLLWNFCFVAVNQGIDLHDKLNGARDESSAVSQMSNTLSLDINMILFGDQDNSPKNTGNS